MSSEKNNLSNTLINKVKLKARAIAFYLPQFHPIKVNNDF